MKRALLAALCGAVAFGVGVARSAAPAADPLSPLARKLIHQGMDEHIHSTSDLFQAVMRLQYEKAAAAADDLVAQPTWARPEVAGPDSVNSRIPQQFFDLQAAMQQNARNVSAAAKKHDPQLLGDAFGKLTSSCLACHAIYLPPQK